MAGEYVFPKSDGDVLYNGDVNPTEIINAVAGENITAGNACYISESDGKVYLSDKDANASNRFTGLAINTTTTGNTVNLQNSGNFTTSGLTANTIYYTSSTAGGVSSTVSSVPIGVAVSSTNLFILPKTYSGSRIKYLEYNDSTPLQGRSYTFTPSTSSNMILMVQFQCTYNNTAGGHGDISFYINNPDADTGTGWQAYDICASVQGSGEGTNVTSRWHTVWPTAQGNAAALCTTLLGDGPIYDSGSGSTIPTLSGLSSYNFIFNWQNHTSAMSVSDLKVRIWWIENYLTVTGTDYVTY